MEATRTAMPCIDGIWNAYVLRMIHPGYRLILRWCDQLDFEDVLRIDQASIVAAATDPNRFIGRRRIAFGNGQLAKAIVPFTLVNATYRYVIEQRLGSGAVFAEICGEAVTRASVRDAIHRALVLLRLAWTFSIDDAGHLV